jgi:methylphosphotriester-DNA--protein-cysteine methyltransferase
VGDYDATYVADTILFHVPTCEMVPSIPANVRFFSDSSEGLIAQGLLPCPLCIGMPAADVRAQRVEALAKISSSRTFATDAKPRKGGAQEA